MKNKFNFSRRNPKTKKIENTGFMEFRNVSNNAADLYIYGDIVSSTWEAWCDEDTCPQDISDFMNQIEPGAELTVYINSGGGDVFAGIAIHSILSRHTGHKTGIVDGMAASIASVILMACDSIVMSSGAQIMIHKPLSWAYGNADDFQRLISEMSEKHHGHIYGTSERRRDRRTSHRSDQCRNMDDGRGSKGNLRCADRRTSSGRRLCWLDDGEFQKSTRRH